MKKIITHILALSMLAGVALSAASCVKVIKKLDKDKTQLYIANYNGGTSYGWLEDSIARFEEKYKETSFEDGKMGAQIFLDSNKSYSGAALTTSVPASDDYEIYFSSAVPYEDLVSANALLDITDLVTKTKNDQDGKTIESKISQSYKDALIVDGKYYGIPLYEAYTSAVTYDAGVFKDKNLYFSNKLDTANAQYPGTNAFVTNANDTKSCGPDGVYGNYDDGLPSTYQEFYKLMERMWKSNVTPFVFTGHSSHYTNQLPGALFANYVGKDAASTVYDFDSNGKPVEIVTGFTGDTPVVEPMVLTVDNANKIKSSLGLYYAAEFCAKVFSDTKYYDTTSASKTYTNLMAMERFMKSGLDGGNYIGMIIEGNWWYNEAKAANLFEALKTDYASTYQKKDFRYMPLPHQYAGTVTPRDAENALTPVMLDQGANYAFINANIPENHIKLAKAFLSFIYGDEELITATKGTNGVIKAVDYDLTEIINEANPYTKSVLEMRSEAKRLNTFDNAFSTNPIYVNNKLDWSFATTGRFFTSKSNGRETQDVLSAFSASVKPTAREYFEGFAVSDNTWNTKFNIY